MKDRDWPGLLMLLAGLVALARKDYAAAAVFYLMKIERNTYEH